jgi:eukaryotic-like serine/threonine-protein kinase
MSAPDNREREVFSTALEYSVPAERAAYLAEACGENAALRQSVESLLRVHEAEGGLLTQRDGASTGYVDVPLHEGPGTRIGRYKLLERIGEGGFGVVYMAEQEEPVRRRVALKVIKLGMDTRAIVARFEAERQALALMEHPNIARVFDGGATDTGRPYFVMELVRGVPITRYCDENRLPPEARLRLFITVCQAVQHAHQKGVIHRDLKPSNILVTLHDGVPVPKVIDFGIAKATSARLTDKTLFTRFYTFVGTPVYTSPEQMEMSGLDVDTRSDIYSLGVLLYELLTGRPPFDPEALLMSGLEAMRRTIREVDPPRPSARLATLSHADRASAAQQRGIEVAKLSLLLRGDLDWIVMHSLEKDRTRRYVTPSALAADIERHLASEPVAARPPSNAYRLRKFIRRHQLGFFAATAVALALLVGLIASSVLLLREQRVRARAVTAERTAVALQHQAEVARADEVKRAARTSLELANRNLADGRVADGLAYLVYSARKDPLNPILAPRLASVLTSHNFILPEGAPLECGSRVVAIRYALDGHTFLAGTQDGTLRVFDNVTGNVLREFRLGTPVLWISGWKFARNNDGIFAARFQDNSLAVFDTGTGRQQASIQLDPGVSPDPNAVGLSPDGRWIFAYAAATTKYWVWDALTGQQRLAESLERRLVLDFDFSADGRQFSVSALNEVQLWSLPDCLPTLAPIIADPARVPRTNDVLFARFLPDGRGLAVLDPYSASIRLCDAGTGVWLGPRIDVESGFSVRGWEFAPDGRLLHVGSKTSSIRDLDTGRITALPFSQRDVFNLDKSFSRDGSLLLVTPTNEAHASLWDTRTGQAAAEFALRLPPGIHGALSPDGAQIVIGTAEGLIHRLRVGRGIARPLVIPQSKPPMPLAFLPEVPARLLWLTGDRAWVLDVASGRELAGGFTFPRKITEPAREVEGKSPLRSDLKFLVVRNGSGWEAWEFTADGVVNVVQLQDDPPPNGVVTFSPAADVVAINDISKLRAWNLRTGACVGPPIVPSHLELPSVNFSPDGRRLAAAYVRDAPVIWEVATSRPASGTFVRDASSTLATVQFSTDGTKILTAEFRGEARVWDTATGAPLSPLIHTADMLYSATFSPDGLYVVTRSGGEMRIWDARTAAFVGEPIALAGLTRGYTRFSADGRRFAAPSQDGNPRLVDVRTAQAYTERMNHGPVRTSHGVFSPDDRFVRIETSANDYRIWSVPPALPDGTPPPEWLLQLATACAGKIVNDQGRLVDVTDTAARIVSLRAEIAALSHDAPLADWGRWILNDRADRSIAPGFTITPAEAEALKTKLAAAQ